MNRKRIVLTMTGVSMLALGAVAAIRFARGGLSLIADPVRYNIAISEELSVPENGFVETQRRYSTIAFSKAEEAEGHVLSLKERGICYNATPINSLSKIDITFDADLFPGATLFYGNYALSEEHLVVLSASNSIEIPDGNSFFVIQSNGDGLLLDSLDIEYRCTPVYEEKQIPQIVISLDEGEVINSRETYASAQVSVIYPDGSFKDIDNAVAGVRLRGNTTSKKPKKPYRIKFDKKQSLFGLEKNKSWALLADYMDASKMHNYTALSFANMVRGESEFTAHPHHVEVLIDGVSQGVYLLTEQMDEKAGRMNLGQDDGYFCSLFDEDGNIQFDQFPFMIERDLSAVTDPLETLDETYFSLELSNEKTVYYSLKYPEREDFVNVDEKGKVIKDEEGNPIIDDEKFQAYFNALKDYVRDMEESFLALNSGDTYMALSEKVDYESLASFGLTDLFMAEADHGEKSAKLYRVSGGKLRFGPVWDYDSCVLRFEYTGNPIDNPPLGDTLVSRATTAYIGDRFARKLFAHTQGRQLFADCWNAVSSEAIEAFKADYAAEMESISELVIKDNDKWYQNASMVFDNYRYMNTWMELRIPFMDSLFAE